MRLLAIFIFAACLSFISCASNARAQAPQRLVFAHYMVCCPRDVLSQSGAPRQRIVDDFLAEIREAKATGIDGFALNCGEWNGRYKTNSAMLFEAARRFGPDFKLFFSADGVSADEAADMVRTYGDHPNALRYAGRPVLSSVSGTKEWREAIRAKVREINGGELFFVPFFYPPDFHEIRTAADVQSLVDDNADVDGYFYFGAGGTPDFLADVIRLNAERWPVRGKLFMAGIAPYYRGIRSNYVIFESNGYDNIVKQWRAAITSNTQWVELVTWNDWAEDTYFESLSAADAQTVTMGEWGELLSHDGFREATRYFIEWFKTGKEPPIRQEQILYAYRLHTKNAFGHPYPGQPTLAKPRGVENLLDRIHILAFLRAPATVVVHVGAQSTGLDLSAGMTMMSAPMGAGEVSFEVVRNGAVLAEKKGEFPISATDGWGNYNSFTGKFPLEAPAATAQ